MADLTPGVYEQLVTKQLQLRLAAIDDALVDRGELDPADAHQILASHLGDLARRAPRSVPGDDADLVAETQDLLRAIAAAPEVPGPVRFPTRPGTPLSVSALSFDEYWEDAAFESRTAREPTLDGSALTCIFDGGGGSRLSLATTARDPVAVSAILSLRKS